MRFVPSSPMPWVSPTTAVGDIPASLLRSSAAAASATANLPAVCSDSSSKVPTRLAMIARRSSGERISVSLFSFCKASSVCRNSVRICAACFSRKSVALGGPLKTNVISEKDLS